MAEDPQPQAVSSRNEAMRSSTPGSIPGRHQSLGIDRAHYVALCADDPAAAAAFAEKYMGLALVHVDGAGRHYLASHGLDAYSVVYVPGPGRTIDHVSYLVPDVAALHRAQATLDAAGRESSGVLPSDLWRHGPALRLRTPSGQQIELTVGANIATTMASTVAPPDVEVGTLTLDHAVVRVTDVEPELAFATDTLGLLESSRIVIPDTGPVLAFFRAHTLYHCFAVARSGSLGLHHHQFSLKDGPAVFRAYRYLSRCSEVDIVWGPVRHGPGHNIAFYIRDQIGNYVEFSAEEEIILDNDTYRPQVWSVENLRSMDEWGSRPPAEFFA